MGRRTVESELLVPSTTSGRRHYGSRSVLAMLSRSRLLIRARGWPSIMNLRIRRRDTWWMLFNRL
jgi:hypothetical protein